MTEQLRATPWKGWINRAAGLCLTVFALWDIFHPSDPLVERSIFVGLLILMVFIRDWVNPTRASFLRIVDLIFMLTTVVVFGYIVLNSEAIDLMMDIPIEAMVMGFIAIGLMIEATRRSMGAALTIMVSLFVVYIFFGQNLPGWLGGHVGFSIRRIISNLYLSTNGMFGIIAHVMLKYVFLFYLFGKFLEWTNALGFIMKFSLALVGHVCGGPAMVAVLASGMMGSVSGSSVANVMVTGTVTIPMMKRVGFKPYVAAGVEAAASSGGQFMPPVMGATAFLIAMNLGIDYLEVIKAATIPAVIYFMGVLVAVYSYARRSALPPLSKEEIPTWREVFGGSESFTFLGGISVLMVLLILRYSAPFAVAYAMLMILIIYILIQLIKRKPLRVADFCRTVSEAPRGFISLGTAASTVGIIVGIILLTGLAGRLSTLVINFSGGSLPLLLAMTMIAALVMGCGLPTSIIYILLSMVLAPALVKMGVNEIAAHMFIFFGGLMSMVTPPVALASYAGAAIADTDLWRASVWGFMLSLPAYILPFAFVIDTSLLMQGTLGHIVQVTLTAAIGVSLLSIALVGAGKDILKTGNRALLVVSAVLLILPFHGSTLLAIIVATPALVRPTRYYIARRREHKLEKVS